MTYYQNVPGTYPVSAQVTNYSYTQHAVNAAITGAVVGAVAGTAKGISQTEKGAEDRVKDIAKVAGRDTALCSASSFAGAMAAGLTGTKGLLSLAIFATAGVGAGYMLNKVMPKVDCTASKETEEKK